MNKAKKVSVNPKKFKEEITIKKILSFKNGSISSSKVNLTKNKLPFFIDLKVLNSSSPKIVSIIIKVIKYIIESNGSILLKVAIK